MDFLINSAMAQTAEAPSFLQSFFPLILIFVLFYFLLIRPQMKRAKEHRKMVSELSTGDEVITNGGILGRITKVSESFLTVELAQGVEVKLQKGAVSTLLPKGTLKSVGKSTGKSSGKEPAKVTDQSD